MKLEIDVFTTLGNLYGQIAGTVGLDEAEATVKEFNEKYWPLLRRMMESDQGKLAAEAIMEAGARAMLPKP